MERKNIFPYKYYTNETILPDRWDTISGLPLAPTARNKRINSIEYKELCTVLKNIEATAKDLLRKLENDGIVPTNELLTNELDKLYKNIKEVEKPQNNDLINFIDSFIENANKKRATKAQYKLVRSNIIDYSLTTGKRAIFEDIDLDCYLGFVDFLTTKGYAPNTIGSRIKNLSPYVCN